jgi:hypothetical protein
MLMLVGGELVEDAKSDGSTLARIFFSPSIIFNGAREWGVKQPLIPRRRPQSVLFEQPHPTKLVMDDAVERAVSRPERHLQDLCESQIRAVVCSRPSETVGQVGGPFWKTLGCRKRYRHLQQPLERLPRRPLPEEAARHVAAKDRRALEEHECGRYRANALAVPESPKGPRAAAIVLDDDELYGEARVDAHL